MRWETPKQVAELIGFDEKTVRRWVYAGEVLAKVSPGGHVRIAVDDDGWPLAPAEED